MKSNEPLTFLKLIKFDISNKTNPKDKFYSGIVSNPYQTPKFYPTGHFRPISKVVNMESFYKSLNIQKID